MDKMIVRKTRNRNKLRNFGEKKKKIMNEFWIKWRSGKQFKKQQLTLSRTGLFWFEK